jgi:acrylyl-CoA reductase (NADPH)
MFKALLLEKTDSGVLAAVQAIDEDRLPEGDVLASVSHSTLNYKDALAITGRGPVVRSWPMVAGIDGAGTVLESSHPGWQAGDSFIHNGWGLGETRWGCLAERASLQGDWLIKLPRTLTTRQAMALGTAGYTAMLAVMRLERLGLLADDGEVLVTGATGGVGSVATMLLSGLGHRVVAATGKMDQADYLRRMGAAEVIDRAELSSPGKPFQKERWTAVVDSVGSHTLANALAQTRRGGTVIACGLAQGSDLPTTVMPFILRGVTLAGVDSVMAPLSLRREAWDRLAQEVDRNLLEDMVEDIALDDCLERARDLMDGRVRGRLVVKV